MSKDAPELFPPSGSFRSVVPLSELAETPDSSESVAPAPPLERLENAIQARPVAVAEGERLTPEDEEETTLVPQRRRASTRALAPRAGRRKSRLPSWRVIVPCLAAMLIGGVIADAFWKNVRRPATADEPASVSEEAPAAAADSGAPADQPPPATDETNARQPQTAPQAPAPEQAVVTEPESVRRAPGEAPAASAGASPKGTRTISAEITSATVIVSPAARRAAAASAAAESRARQPSPPRGAGDRSAAEPRAVRQEARPVRRPRGAQNQVLTSSSRDQSLPVFSPPPGKQGKKEVIQWP
jgi:hypothetical protein